MNTCEKFDIYNNRWYSMPSMNTARGNPGTMISSDRKYLYAFQGFVNVKNPLDDEITCEVLNSIERLDL
jgi:hypothetical protein